MTIVSPRLILAIVGTAAIPLFGVAFAQIFMGVDIGGMTRDVSATQDIHPLLGVLSSLGVLLWWTSTTIWFFAALLQRGRDDSAVMGFFVYSGLLSAYLGLDDLFLIHEYLAPIYLAIPELVVYGLLAVAVGFYLLRYRQLLLRPDALLLLLALGFLACSVVIDAILQPWLWRLKDWIFFLEDGLKWIGICFWASFSVVRSSSHLRSLLQVSPRKQ